jgi:ABC-2 type transport system permease protein
MKIIEELRLRINLLKINTVFTFQEQTAYIGENLASILSTTFYSISAVLFINILYSNVNTFAGYDKNQMLLLLLTGQLGFYILWIWSSNNTEGMIEDVRSGDLDLLLTKPVPSLFYVTFKKISLVRRLKDGLPNLLIIAYLINWNELVLTNFFAGFIIFLFGQVAWHFFRFLFALPVFWQGQSTNIYMISGSLGETKNIPFEGFPGKLRFSLSTIIPTLLTSTIVTSVILGKANPYEMILLSGVVAFIFFILGILGWNLALKNYTSASS